MIKKNSLLFPFFLALIAPLIIKTFYPEICLLYFSPFLILSLMHLPFSPALFIALFCGLLVDLLSTTPFGMTALNYTLISALLYRQKRFFNDKPHTLSFFTMLFSIASTLLQLLLLFIFHHPLMISPKWVLTDLIVYPLLDGLYAFLWFYFPIYLFTYLYRNMRRFFILRNKRSSSR